MRYLLLITAFLVGLVFRERIGDSFRLFYRGQAALLGSPLALLAGWNAPGTALLGTGRSCSFGARITGR